MAVADLRSTRLETGPDPPKMGYSWGGPPYSGFRREIENIEFSTVVAARSVENAAVGSSFCSCFTHRLAVREMGAGNPLLRLGPQYA